MKYNEICQEQLSKKSAYDFGNKKARSYINVLEARISEQRRLNQQMGK